jgi:hypothetical protein
MIMTQGERRVLELMLTAGLGLGLSARVDAQPPAGDPKAPAKSADGKAGETKADAKAATKSSVTGKVAKPTREMSRREHIARPGAERSVVPLTNSKSLMRGATFTDADRAAFDQMRKGARPLEPVILDRVARYKIATLTDPGRMADYAGMVQEILRDTNLGSNPGAGAPAPGGAELKTRAIVGYKTALAKASREVFAAPIKDFGLTSRLNITVLLTELNDGKGADSPEPVRVLVELITGRPPQEDAVIYAAMRGLQAAKRVDSPSLTVQAAREASAGMMEMCVSEDVQDELIRQFAETFGALGRPGSGDDPELLDIATWLASVTLETGSNARPLPVRFEAALAFARLDMKYVNNGLQAETCNLVVTRGMLLLHEMFEAGLITEDQNRYLHAQMVTAIKNLAASSREPEINSHLNDVLKPVAEAVFARNGAESREPLASWIKAHTPPKQPRINRRTPGIPALLPKEAGKPAPAPAPAAGAERKAS